MLTLRFLKKVGWIVGLFWYYYTGVSNTVIYKFRWAFWQILHVNVKHFERSRSNRWTVLILLNKSFKYWRLVPIWEESQRALDNYCTWAMPIYINFAKFSVWTSINERFPRVQNQHWHATVMLLGYSFCAWNAAGILTNFLC